MTPRQRVKSWSLLESFSDVIINKGGRAIVNKIESNDAEDNLIEFAGFVPDYAIKFMNSELFFPAVQLDSRHETGISGGKLYVLITITGDRTVLPIAAAWAPTENSKYTDMLFDLLEDDIHLIQSCHTDEGKGLIKSIQKNNIANHLCLYHLSLHCSQKSMLIKLSSAEDSHQYALIKSDVLTNYPDLVDYLNKGDRWKKISRFESPAPRDMNLATSCVESFNAFINRNNLKNKEPIVIFKAIYEFGYMALKKISFQTNYLTNSASKWMSYAMKIAHFLQVITPNSNYGIFEVAKPNEDPTCTVTMLPGQQPDCTCRFYADCGMPCVHILAVAFRLNLDWCQWVHPRFFPLKYNAIFGKEYKYIDFNQIVPKGNGKPLKMISLKQRQKRYKHPAEF